MIEDLSNLPLVDWIREQDRENSRKALRRTEEKELEEEYQEYLKLIDMGHVEKVKYLQQFQKPDEIQQVPYPH